MLVLKAIYEHGQIRLLEPVPEELPEPQEVTVTFPEMPSAANADASLDQEATEAALSIIGLIADFTPEQMAAFDEALERKSPFFGPREVTW